MKIIINETQERLLLKEFLEKTYTKPLMHYFSMSQEEKDNDMLETFIDYFYDFITEYDCGEPYGFSDEEMKEIAEYLKDGYDSDEIYDRIVNGDFNVFKKDFLHYINNRFEYDWELLPAWTVMDSPREVRNKWLIHFSDNAYDISKNGFKYGTDTMERLSYTGAGDIDNKFGEGYNFAYDTDDFGKFYKKGRYSDSPRYGDEAVMFISNGVKVWHYGDEEYQVIFWGANARDFVYLSFDEDERYWCVYSVKTNNIIYKNEDIENVVDWVKNNYIQYRKHINSEAPNANKRNFERNY